MTGGGFQVSGDREQKAEGKIITSHPSPLPSWERGGQVRGAKATALRTRYKRSLARGLIPARRALSFQPASSGAGQYFELKSQTCLPLNPLNKRGKTRVAILGRLLLIGLLGLLLVGCAAKDNLAPADVVQRYLEAVRDNNYAQAYDLLTADSQLKITKADFGDRQSRAKQDAGISKIEIVKVNREVSIVGKRASATYQLEVTLQSGEKLSLFEAAVLLQQESGWRIIWPPQ